MERISDSDERCSIQMHRRLASNIKLQGRLAPTGKHWQTVYLPTPFFFYYTSVEKFSAEAESAMEKPNLCNASLLNRRSKNKNICKKANHCHMNLQIKKSVSSHSSAFIGSRLKLCFNNASHWRFALNKAASAQFRTI